MREYGRYLDNRSIMGDVHKIIRDCYEKKLKTSLKQDLG